MGCMSDTRPHHDCGQNSIDPERVLEVMFMFANGYAGHNLSDDSPEDSTYAVKHQGDNLLFTVTSECMEVTNADLLRLSERFKKWRRRGDSAITLEEFFKDLNRWGKTGEFVIQKILALIMLAEHALKELETKRQEDFWEPLKRMLPRRFHFKATPESPAYNVDFCLADEGLLFKKNAVTTMLEREDVSAVWLRYVESECMAWGRDKDFELETTANLSRWTQGLGAEKWSDYGYELASLMHEMEMQAAFPDEPRR